MVNDRPDVRPSALYSKKEAAQHLGVSLRTINRYAADGRLKFRPSRANGRPLTTGQQILKLYGTY